MKNLLNLNGATKLSATEQKAVQGGGFVDYQCDMATDCGSGGCWLCIRGRCKNYCL
ncbi:hypothetical protein [Gilvibacter sediminis]|uniref:hypothetical protein n=1 Tax=Gilvibacter sediminis TaxID=379071 RepID=UPI002350C705|nr:hypothetical protein [Gilvibacter sediminis]MDC7997403.1 hypothetical protein [Gilvibacter sediminis]